MWWGWMVGSEPDYACEWDFVLGSDDEPRDPLATTVQLWNPVRIYLPSVARVIGQLTPQRHAALRSLVADFLSGDEATQVNVAPQEGQTSFLVFRATSAGHQVTTGLPLSGPDDPRRVYQTLYEGAADVLRQPALLAARAAALANWLPRASVQQTGVNRFVATAAHNAELTLELEYQLPGSGKPLVLMQKMGQARHDATLRLGDLSIKFIGGIAAPDPDGASRVASLLGLPLAFVEWPALSKEFARSRGETSGRMREVIKAILDAATSAKRASHEVFQFLFAELTPIGAARSRGATSVPLVLDMASLGDSRFRLELWWFEPPPEVGAVKVFVDGREVQLRTPANWIKSPTVLELDGCNVEPASLAAARFTDGVLRLDLWTTSETRI